MKLRKSGTAQTELREMNFTLNCAKCCFPQKLCKSFANEERNPLVTRHETLTGSPNLQMTLL